MSPTLAYLIIATPLVLGMALFTLPRSWAEKNHGCLKRTRIGFVLFGLFGLLSRFGPIEIWDGGYSTAEFQITFHDLNNQAVDGVELRVEDRSGHTFFNYPVTDFRPDRVPTSDRNGLMVLHHVGGGAEFGGRCWHLYFWFPVEERPRPEYVCRFLCRYQEVYRVQYHEMNSWRVGKWDEVEKVTRRWKRPDWPVSLFFVAEEESLDEHRARTRKLFDLNGDGKLNTEEGAAYHAAMNYRNEKAVIARLKGEDPEEELEFPVVRRTVRISPMPE